MRKIIYAATPLRMQDQVEPICSFIQSQGFLPLHPFLALPPTRYNLTSFSRDELYRVFFSLIDISDELWIFGLGSGSLKEVLHATNGHKPVRSFVKQFDTSWETLAHKEKYLRLYPSALSLALA